MIYVAPAWVRDAIPGHRDALPYFAEPVAVNPSLAGLYHRCYAAVMSGNALARESLLLRLLAAWFDRHGERSTMARPHPRARPQVQRVRDFLHSFPERNVSLRQLAEIAALSPYHLLRVFSADLGMPPHRYLTQLRVWRATRLLAEGRSISDTALAVGFADQSHLTRHFKRHTGITPGRYQPRSASR
jgi:AraC-like DNA-binding protein